MKCSPHGMVFETVAAEAARYGVPVIGSEIVGLVPAEALQDTADHFLRLEGFTHVDDWVPQQLITATGPNPLPR